MNRAIDQVSGRIFEPKILTEENAWRKTRRYNWNRGNGYEIDHFWTNMISNRQIEITKEEFENQSQPNL
jgi:hypothetical protein